MAILLSYVMLWCKQDSSVGEYCEAVTLHVSWCSIHSNSPTAPKSTFIHSCHQHTFERFLFMLVTPCPLFSAFCFDTERCHSRSGEVCCPGPFSVLYDCLCSSSAALEILKLFQLLLGTIPLFPQERKARFNLYWPVEGPSYLKGY